jgi:sulfotransferase family protein
MDEFKLDFSGIGVAKAGTTWIARCLAEHPSVCMARSKETNFFLRKHLTSVLPARRHHYGSSHYDEGLDWYKQQFSHHQPGQLRGEYSNAYIADPESAALLHAHNPEMKLLCCFRSPIEGAYSGYFQLSRVQPLPDTFDEFLDTYPQLQEYGRYHHNLQPFLKLFPRDRIHILLFEDIRKDPVAVYRGICEFLGIDPSFVPAIVTETINPRTVLRSRVLRNIRVAVADFMVSTPARRKLRASLVRLGAARLAIRLFHMNEKPGRIPPMSPAARQRLVELYRRDIGALGELLQRDLSQWTESPSSAAPLSQSRPSTSEARSL